MQCLVTLQSVANLIQCQGHEVAARMLHRNQPAPRAKNPSGLGQGLARVREDAEAVGVGHAVI